MKFFKTTFLLLLLSAVTVNAQGRIVAEKMKRINEEFRALPEEKRTAYSEFKKKAFKAREKEKYLSCLVALMDAQSIFRKDMDLLFLNGICRAQLHDVDSAIELYKEVLEIDNNHVYTLLNIIEINFFAGRYEEAVKYIEKVNKLADSRANTRLPLLDFKYLISLTKLSKENPTKYGEQLSKMQKLYTHMDDVPYYYYSKALKSFDAGDKQEGLIWILKAYLIFDNAPMIETWNKALVDTKYIGAHEIMFKRGGDAKK